MGKGLKDMVAEAMQAEQLPPVEVSPEATRTLAEYLRQWAGWPSARLVFGDPRPTSPWASTNHVTHTFTVNIDALLLNPNRVLLTLTPFRMRQEAVLTGAAMHEAGHARHSNWMPKTEEEAKAKPLLHSDGTEPTRATVALARVLEEPRVEGLMVRDADHIGATGLGWTMRATAAHVMPMTDMPTDPNEAVMALVRSWVLRAGRQYAISHWDQSHKMRRWVSDFTSLVHGAIVTHLLNSGVDSPQNVIDAKDIMEKLVDAVAVTDDTGPTLIDMARDVLALLFPETPPEEQPEAGGGCTGNGENEESEAGDDESTGEGDESGEQGEGNTEPEDEGSGDEPGAGDSGTDEAEPEQAEPEQADQSGEGDSEPEQDEQAEQDSATGSTEQPEQDEPEQSEQPEVEAGKAEQSELAKSLAEMEARVSAEADEEAEEDAEDAEEEAAAGAGAGSGDGSGGEWRKPTAEERQIQHGAEKFLRDLIAPSEASKVVLTESPSATVDGAALAAWKAGGQVRDPRFFVRTRRTIEPSPPVQIAVLADVSLSMSILQRPSALLSWALSAAAIDLRNFAGRGQQVESCLIHWGDHARVMVRNGELMPGIREWSCNEGTSAMGEALALVEQELPGFFEVKDRPVNRLLVHFTDWELSRWSGRDETVEWTAKALEAGVNMISVVPSSFRNGRGSYSAYPDVMSQCKVQRGTSTILKYNPDKPADVWTHAAKALA